MREQSKRRGDWGSRSALIWVPLLARPGSTEYSRTAPARPSYDGCLLHPHRTWSSCGLLMTKLAGRERLCHGL